MNKACDLFALAITAFKEGKYDSAAKFFSSAMGSDDLDSFVNDIARNVPRSALTGLVPSSENTLSPSLASADSEDLSYIVERIEAGFRAECSLLDEGDEEAEVRASDEDEDDDLDEEDDLDDEDDDDLDAEDTELDDEEDHNSGKMKLTASAGPVRFK